MQISRSSWHYKLYRYEGSVMKGPRYLNPFAKLARDDVTPPRNLCPYTWAILLGLVGVAVLAAIALVLSPFLIVGFVLFKVASVLGRAINAGADEIDKGFWVWLRKLKGIELPDPPPRVKRRRGPSLLAATLRARKDKVCPTIELVD